MLSLPIRPCLRCQVLQLAEAYRHREVQQSTTSHELSTLTNVRSSAPSASRVASTDSTLTALRTDRSSSPFTDKDLQRRGCPRTAFEHARLLSLDPLTDPHGVLLHLDYLSVKAGIGDWLLNLWNVYQSGKVEETEGCMDPNVLPGWGYARALLLRGKEKERKNRGEDAEEESTEALRQAILAFPSVIPLLADKCDIPLPTEPSPPPLSYTPSIDMSSSSTQLTPNPRTALSQPSYPPPSPSADAPSSPAILSLHRRPYQSTMPPSSPTPRTPSLRAPTPNPSRRAGPRAIVAFFDQNPEIAAQVPGGVVEFVRMMGEMPEDALEDLMLGAAMMREGGGEVRVMGVQPGLADRGIMPGDMLDEEIEVFFEPEREVEADYVDDLTPAQAGQLVLAEDEDEGDEDEEYVAPMPVRVVRSLLNRLWESGAAQEELSGDDPYAPQLGARLHVSHSRLNVIGLAGNVGVYSSGLVWGRIVDLRGPRIPLIGASICLLFGYSGIKRIYGDGVGGGTTVSALHFAVLVVCGFMTGLGGNAGPGAAVNTTARSFPDTARNYDWFGTFWLRSLTVLVVYARALTLPRQHIRLPPHPCARHSHTDARRLVILSNK
ncbi:hypothetical protein HYDPIDRAFT_44450 [Hydnomerulius pinastri MD-312]|uniref:Uncharacterized protein n=1 Tax=Hydnomerulius pinastri MD-312 TaxID=994086 RepID=A0A0C9W7L8_9AGAM|nr:hypothetical protein HYDPIDRAFT_44450 [Hydnomerulius pinastri MD-312]